MAQYIVQEAVLHQRSDGTSVWQVRFRSTGDQADETTVEISPARLERMSFAAPYSESELDELRQPK